MTSLSQGSINVMPASSFAGRNASEATSSAHDDDRNGHRLRDLSQLANADIETALVADLSGNLHALFDPVSEDTLPIYFGPLLGRLYLEGL